MRLKASTANDASRPAPTPDRRARNALRSVAMTAASAIVGRHADLDGSGCAGGRSLEPRPVLHVDGSRRRHIYRSAPQLRCSGRQRDDGARRRERRGARSVLHDQHHDAPEPGCADHEVVRPRQLGDRQLRVRPRQHRRRVLAAQRRELLRSGPVGLIRPLPRRQVLRALQHEQPGWRVHLHDRRHRRRPLDRDRTRTRAARPLALLRRGERRHCVHLLRGRERRTPERHTDADRAGVPECHPGRRLRRRAVHRRTLRRRPGVLHRRPLLHRHDHLAVRSGSAGGAVPVRAAARPLPDRGRQQPLRRSQRPQLQRIRAGKSRADQPRRRHDRLARACSSATRSRSVGSRP